jgi:hypothetical protein
MDWNDFNREMQKRVSDAGTRYCMGIIYERLLDACKQVDHNNELLLAFAQTMQAMVNVNEDLASKVRGLQKTVSGQRDGVSVESVPITNED